MKLNKGIKTALVFVGGAIVGGVATKIKCEYEFIKAVKMAFGDDYHTHARKKYDGPRFQELDHKDYTFEFDTRADAEEILSAMYDIMETYGVVSVVDLFDLLDEQHVYMAKYYGWTNLEKARVVRTRDAYVLELPRAIRIV